jgi:hypothetical protein
MISLICLFEAYWNRVLKAPVLVSLDDPLLTQLSDPFTQPLDPVLVDTDNNGLFDIKEEVPGPKPHDPDTEGTCLKMVRQSTSTELALSTMTLMVMVMVMVMVMAGGMDLRQG